MHYEEQLVRAAVDTAHEEPASRIALLAVGADLGTRAALPEWQVAVDAGLATHGPDGARAIVHNSSWAQLGDAIEAVVATVPALAVYAEDVLARMRFKGMLGYKGARVYEDLEGGLTIVNAFEVVNRAAAEAPPAREQGRARAREGRANGRFARAGRREDPPSERRRPE